MGYIIKSPTGGGGDATAANQTTQINEAQTTNSALYDVAGPVLKDANNSSVFNNYLSQESVFKTTNGNSIFEKSKISNINTLVQSFQNTTPALLATDIQTFLQANIVCIIQIVYADAGGIAPNPHTALIIYNAI
jgi:hypothetical protein